MIDLIQQFERKETEIAEYVRCRADAYYLSDCYKKLDRRITDLQNSNDLKPAVLRRNQWISNVVFPIVKERSLLRRAITAANYRASETFNLSGIGSTPQENAVHAELVLNLNLAHTFFKAKCLKPSINTASKFGSAVVYTYWKEDDSEKLKTVYNDQTGAYDRVRVPNNQKNAVNVEVNLRDYFQNPDVPDPEQSDFQGHFKRVHITELIRMQSDENYIAENLQKVIDDLKKGVIHNAGRPYKESDAGKWGTDILRWEGTIHIKGNEDGYHKYCCEMIGKTIIKFTVDDYDNDISSYTVLNFDKRHEFWWGNSDSEYVVSHENFLNTFLSMSADNALRSMMQYVFFNKETIDPSDINNVYRNNGFIPADVKNQRLSDMIMPFQPGNVNLTQGNFITQAVNDSIQKLSTKVDLSRRSDQGGVQNNSTATAANILSNQAEVLESDLIENFDYGVQEIGKKDLILLQQFLSELFYVRPRPQDAEKMLYKYQILGDFEYEVNSTASKNKQGEMLRMQNLATWMLNIMANPIMQQAGYNIVPMVNDILQKAELPSVDEIIPNEQSAMAAPGMVQSNPMQAAGTGGNMIPMIQQQPQQQMQGAI